VLQVGVHGADADAQRPGDGPVLVAVGDKLQDAGLARCEQRLPGRIPEGGGQRLAEERGDARRLPDVRP
jgi:hypothetical protein